MMGIVAPEQPEGPGMGSYASERYKWMHKTHYGDNTQLRGINKCKNNICRDNIQVNGNRWVHKPKPLGTKHMGSEDKYHTIRSEKKAWQKSEHIHLWL